MLELLNLLYEILIYYFQIYEKESSIQIELHNFNDLMESTQKLSEDLSAMRQEMNDLNEKIDSIAELGEEISSIKKTLDRIQGDVYSLAHNTRFYR